MITYANNHKTTKQMLPKKYRRNTCSFRATQLCFQQFTWHESAIQIENQHLVNFNKTRELDEL